MLRFAPLLLVLLLAVPLVQAQSTSAVRRVVLTDGTVLVGTIANENADPLVVVTADGIEQRVPRARVARITGLIGGRFTRADPTRTRTLIAPTARTLGGGETRLGVTSYILPTVTRGLSDRIDVYASGFFTFSGDGGALIVVGAKGALIDTGSLAVAVGTTAGIPITTGSDINGSFFLLPYGVATAGSETVSVSLGVTGVIGGSVDSGDVAFGDGALLSLGGEVQVANGFKLLADAFVPVGEGSSGAIVLPGVRFFTDRFSADLYAIGAFTDGDSGVFGPIANFSYRF